MKTLIKKIIWSFLGGYRPRRFWDSLANSFLKDCYQVELHSQHGWLLGKIKLIKPRKILEIGCGFGRNIRFLIDNGFDPEKITGIDISPKMIKNAKKYIDSEKVKLLIADAGKLPFKSSSFDLVMVHGVFMHVLPSQIERAIKEAVRVSNKFIIDIEQNYLPSKKTGSSFFYTFVHDYEKIYKKLSCYILEKIKNKKQGLDYYFISPKPLNNNGDVENGYSWNKT